MSSTILRTGIILLFTAILIYRLASNPSLATFGYIAVSWALDYDRDQPTIQNYDGQIEDHIFKHRFIPINQTYHGLPVEATYHVVECGKEDAEPIVFGHGLCENWRVWKKIMTEFCSTHRVVAYDSEGMGQSAWPNVLRDLPKGQSTTFMADMQMEMLRKIGIRRFNLVITDYSFWTTLSMLSDFGDTILRYGKLQSTVGVEDVNRIPQGKLMKAIPRTMDFITNLNKFALARVLFGKPLLQWPAVVGNRRNAREIPDSEFNEVILSGLRENGLTAWVYFYNYGRDMCAQMDYQIDVFRQARYPVLILQGDSDRGQPKELFDGTAAMEIVERPAVSMREKMSRYNHTHVTVTTYSGDGSVIGPKADEFFPNSPWKKLRMLEGIGHFPHMEAPDVVVSSLKELFDVPLSE